MQAGVSTLGIEFGYSLEATKGTKPAAFTRLDRINQIAGISLETETIDASALEDLVTRTVAGRQDTGGTWPITINVTNETITQWKTLMAAYANRENKELSMWFEVWSPNLTDAFFVVAEPPAQFPMSEMAQNELQTVEITLTIQDYKGLQTAVRPTGE